MDQYIIEAKELLLQNFSPINNGNSSVLMTTQEIYKTLKGVVPSGIFSEHDVFDIMDEEGFIKKLQTFYKKDEDGKDTNVISHQLFMWVLYTE